MKKIAMLQILGAIMLGGAGIGIASLGSHSFLFFTITGVIWLILGGIAWTVEYHNEDGYLAAYQRYEGKEKIKMAAIFGPGVWVGYILLFVVTLLHQIIISYTEKGRKQILAEERRKQAKKEQNREDKGVTTF